jgi:P4 family phage/plasmid primase-like protien
MNVGLPLGEASGYVGIDIDNAAGEVLLEEMSHNDTPDTWEYTTGEGRRLLYRIPVGIPTKKFKKTGDDKHEECALMCTGQQTVLPPSLHYKGKTYEWKTGHSPYDIDCAMAPKWLIDLIKLDNPQRKPSNVRNSNAPEKFVVDMSNLSDEFTAGDFVDYVPEELTDIKNVEVKSQKGKKVDEDSIEAQLYQTIGEGSRDNTMTQIIGHFLAKHEYRSMPKEMFLTLMYDYNSRYCDPPLDDSSIESKVNYFWEIEAQKTAGYKSAARGKKEWLIDDVVNIVLNKLEEEGIVIKYDQAKEAFYYSYKNIGPWMEDDENFIRSKMWQYLKDGSSGDESWGSQHRLAEATEAIKLELIARGRSKRQLFDMNVHKDELSELLVVDGKLLNWRTGELLPWSTDYNSTVNFNINYDANAKCPNWEAYMKEWLPDDAIRNLLQEFMGSCLLPKPAPEEKFIILSGHGSNGKSMFLKGMKHIFEEYSISLTPQKLSERFGPSALYGKLVNVCSEIEGDGGYIKNTAQLKAIVSGESLTAEYKGKDVFQFDPVANLIFSCNTIPKSKDKTQGWYRRQLIIPFDQTFTPNSVKAMEMEKNMRIELPGIFNWLLEGLRRIELRGYFIIAEGLKEAQDDFKAINDPMEGFIKDCLLKTDAVTMQTRHYTNRAQIGVSTEIIKELYSGWCKYSYGEKDNAYKKSNRLFNQEMESRGIEKEQGYCVYKKKKTAVFLNVDINLTNYELCMLLEQEFNGCAVTEPGFHLHELAKQKTKEWDKE